MRFTSIIIKILTIILFATIMVKALQQAPNLYNRIEKFLSNWQLEKLKDSSKYGGTLVWGVTNTPTLINPVLTSNSISASLIGLIFDPLFRKNEKGEIVPNLVKSWDISNDGLTYTFHLYENIYFHDGVRLTAKDVKYTYELVSDPSNQSPGRTSIEIINQWKIIDENTIQLVLKSPTNDLLSHLIVEILPEHCYKNSNIHNNKFNYSPIGTGPFKFRSWDKITNQITLIANESYFQGRPYLNRIEVKTYLDNTVLWAAIMRGEVDLVNFLEFKDYQTLKNDSSFKVFQIPSGFYYGIVFNLHDPILFDDDVRKALSCAINRQALMKSIGINGVEINGPFLSDNPVFNQSIEKPIYNPIRAKMILAGRGWIINSQGILEKAGKPLILSMLVAENQGLYNQMALVLRQQLAELGIGLRIIFYKDEQELTSDFLDRTKPQMWLRMFIGSNIDQLSIAQTWYSRSSEYRRLWSYQHDEIDQLFQIVRNKINQDEILDITQKIQTIISKDQPACFLFTTVSYHAISSEFSNVDEFFNVYMPVSVIRNWYIHKERRGYGNN